MLSREYAKILLQKLRKQKASNVSGKYEISHVNVAVDTERQLSRTTFTCSAWIHFLL